MSAVPVYRVTVDTPLGRAVLDVPSLQGERAAGRRGWLTALQQGWGDVGDITVAQVALACCPEPYCDGELHYTGRNDPETNEDIEAGPCPWAS